VVSLEDARKQADAAAEKARTETQAQAKADQDVAVKAEAERVKAEARERVNQIADLCAIGGCEADAATLIASDLSIEQVRGCVRLKADALRQAGATSTAHAGTTGADEKRTPLHDVYAQRNQTAAAARGAVA
jgi:hypothetical protein